MPGLNATQLQGLIKSDFAPWIQSLDLEPVERSPSDIDAKIMRFILPENQALVRSGNVLCGQAIAAVADTASVLCLFGYNEPIRPLTTVDLNCQFLRPLFLGPLAITAIVQSNGKRMANVRTEFRAMNGQEGHVGTAKLAATAACTFTYLD